MEYLFFKALHIVGFVSWFAGIFYIVRLFVYHREAWESTEAGAEILRRQYQIMEGRLYHIIQTPAMLMTLIGGIGMLFIQPAWLSQAWLHLKLLLVFLLLVYHWLCYRQMQGLKKSATALSSFSYRLFNEVPTLILIAIVMLAVWKHLSGLWYGLLLLLVLGLIIFAVAKIYKRRRDSRDGSA